MSAPDSRPETSPALAGGKGAPISAWTLWLSAFGAAAAWSAALLADVAIGGTRCVRSDSGAPRFGTTWWVLTALALAATVVSVYALMVTVGVLRRPVDAPERQRVRFMAFGGMLLNVMFLIGLLFHVASLFLAPVCL